MLKNISVALALLAIQATTGQAAVLDFAEVSPGFQRDTALTLSNALIATTPNTDDDFEYDIFVFEPSDGDAGGFCATLNGICIAPAAIEFTLGPISNLAFDVAGFQEGDGALTLVFEDVLGNPIAQQNITSAGRVSFGDLAGIRVLATLFTGTADAGGLSYRNITFDQGTDTPVIPLPATLPLLAGALGLGALLRRRT